MVLKLTQVDSSWLEVDYGVILAFFWGGETVFMCPRLFWCHPGCGMSREALRRYCSLGCNALEMGQVSYEFTWIYHMTEFVEGKIYRKPWFSPWNIGGYCKFSLQPIQWTIWTIWVVTFLFTSINPLTNDDYPGSIGGFLRILTNVYPPIGQSTLWGSTIGESTLGFFLKLSSLMMLNDPVVNGGSASERFAWFVSWATIRVPQDTN